MNVLDRIMKVREYLKDIEDVEYEIFEDLETIWHQHKQIDRSIDVYSEANKNLEEEVENLEQEIKILKKEIGKIKIEKELRTIKTKLIKKEGK